VTTQKADILHLLDNLSGTRILIVGDVMLDRFVYGDVDRVSPEAPVPVLGIRREEAMLGGAGNVARNISALGAKVHLIGLCGDDDAGRAVHDMLSGLPGVDPRLVVDAGRASSVKTRFVAGNQQLLRTDIDDHQPVSAQSLQAIITATSEGLTQADVLVLSDYAKGVLADDVLATIIAAARKAGVSVIADPKGHDFGRYRGASVLTPNRAELQAAALLPVGNDAQAVMAARQIQQDCGIDSVLATRGPQGMTLLSGSREPLHIATQAREVFDVSGAGDTVVAALAVGLAAGADPGLAAAFANQAAGVVVGKAGTAVAWPNDIVSALHSADLHSVEGKISDAARAKDIRASWLRSGERVVFTNGCFDLVHPGHVSLLSQARSAGDRLIVGLNSDQSVKRLKGESRPVNPETARATVLASLGAVDLVIIFDEDTPLELIEALRPDVLVKGADYSEEEVVGGKEVKSWGGQVVLANLVDGESTSNTISKLNTSNLNKENNA
jgi:D-beta-D-heptose 7-phosphate kinase / D-beta-D-heptose 1-phosphate adenosyltransferase